eukprot:19460-Heterococcus_DN1.PRE.1
MARAFLKLHDDLRAAFVVAQEDSAVRWLLVSIEAETSLVCKGQSSSSASVQQDFDSLVTELQTDCPAIVLFRLAPETSNAKWLLISWVPESSKPRLKMLYSTSKADLKEGLGIGCFDGEYHASDMSE